MGAEGVKVACITNVLVAIIGQQDEREYTRPGDALRPRVDDYWFAGRTWAIGSRPGGWLGRGREGAGGIVRVTG